MIPLDQPLEAVPIERITIAIPSPKAAIRAVDAEATRAKAGRKPLKMRIFVAQDWR